jgi:hypothetical protein
VFALEVGPCRQYGTPLAWQSRRRVGGGALDWKDSILNQSIQPID